MQYSQSHPGTGNMPPRIAASHTATSISSREEILCMENEGRMEKATFAAGCFWGVEAEFRRVKGVIGTAVGYTGGTKSQPTYRQVCSGKTGHAEAVEVIFDPTVITYDKLLDIFWNIHDPTELNRQGPDIGTNYRSAIFYHTPEQKAAAEISKERLSAAKKFRGKKIATEIVPATEFFRAEDYHQQYYEKNGQGYCAIRQIQE